MSDSPRRLQPSALLNPLLGMALVVAAGLLIALLFAIGSLAWQRATLSERWLQVRQCAPSAQDDAQELRQAVADAQNALAGAQANLPTDADVARFISGIPTLATACGVTLVQLAPQPAASTVLKQRTFALRAQGPPAGLLALLGQIARAAPTGTRIETVSLSIAGDRGELDLTLVMLAR